MSGPTRNPFVYFIRPIGQEGPVKIGCSETPILRLSALMAWAPVPLEIVATIPGDQKLERRIHGIFDYLHSHHEWFRSDERLTNFVAALAAGHPITSIVDFSAPLLPFRPESRKRNYNEDKRRYLSYSARLRWALQRLRKRGEEWYSPPADVNAILERWLGYNNGWGRKEPIIPTPEEMQRLEEVLQNPAPYAQQHIIPRRVMPVEPSQVSA